MDEFSAILICLSGYITLSIYRTNRDNYFNITDGWMLIFKTLFFGSINLFFTELIISLLHTKLSNETITAIKAFCYHYTDNRFVWMVVFSIPVSIITARVLTSKTLILASFISKELFMKGFFANWKEIWKNIWNWRRLTRLPESNFYRTVYDLFNQIVLIIMHNGKVYVGFLEDADLSTTTPFNEKAMTLKPIISGYRDEEHRVIYTTNYCDVENTEAITLYLKDLSSIRKFDQQAHSVFSDTAINNS